MGENLKTAKKTISMLGLMFTAGTFLIFAVQILPTVLANLLAPQILQDANLTLLLQLLPMYAIGMPALIFMVRKTIPGETPRQNKLSVGKFLVAAIMCYSLMYISNLVGLLITFVIGLVKKSAVPNVIMDFTATADLPLLFLYTVICAPVFEEYIFRKLIVDRTARYGQGVAIFISGLMFGLFHGNLNQFVYAFTLGCFLAFLYVRTGSLKAVILLHMFVNFMGGIAGTLLMRIVDMQEYQRLMMLGDGEAMMEFVYENLAGFILYGAFVMLVFALVVTGVVLWAVFRKKVRTDNSLVLPENRIPKGKRFNTILLNPGMIAYSAVWIVIIVQMLL